MDSSARGKSKRPQGRCVFCRGRELTKQHIWPKWLKKINQPEVTSHSQVKVSATYVAGAPAVRAKTHQGHSGSRTARKVCKKCNNGWIERLEERIRHPVTSLMAGKPIVLESGTQRDVAAWITLVTMMVEFTDPPSLASPRTDYIRFYESGHPPDHWKVWLARHGGGSPGDHVVRHFGMQLSEFPDVRVEDHKCDTQVTTFVIGHLCAHSFCSSVISGVGDDDYALSDLPQIWPSTGEAMDWARVHQLTDRGVISLASALVRGIPRAPS